MTTTEPAKPTTAPNTTTKADANAKPAPGNKAPANPKIEMVTLDQLAREMRCPPATPGCCCGSLRSKRGSTRRWVRAMSRGSRGHGRQDRRHWRRRARRSHLPRLDRG